MKSLPGFSKDTTRASFNADGKYCLRRTTLIRFVRKVIARFGRCLKTLFGIFFGPGALPTWRPLMACWTSEGLVNFGSLAGAYSYARIASLTISITAGSTDRSPAETEPQSCRRGFPLSQSLRVLVLLALARETKKWELPSPSLSYSIATGAHCPRIPAYRSTLRSATRSIDRSPTFGGGCPGLSELGPS
jgi:hypothetical protein